MNRIGLFPIDSKYPNLALMKVSAYHKSLCDIVEWHDPLEHYDKVYVSKIFSYTPDYAYYINAHEIERGGTGYDIGKELPEIIDKMQPDYSIYPLIDKRTATAS